jgi:tetratricopeptide (TPR) repeat protein
MLRDDSPYRVLGVTDSASWDEIRQAYDERKAAFAHDQFLPEVRSSCREELQIIETGLVEVFLKIQSLRMDAAGEKQRGREEAHAPSLEDMQGKRLESTKTSRQAEMDEAERRAFLYLQKAKDAFRENDFHNTVEFCVLANRHFDGNAECHALLGQALAKNPARRWQIRAEAALKRALELDPWNPHFFLRMGEFYRDQGMDQRAARYFEKAYEISPSLREEGSPPASRA